MSPSHLATPDATPVTPLDSTVSHLATYNAAFLAGYQAEINRRATETRGAK